MDTILENLSVYMFDKLFLNVLLLKCTISPTLKEPALQNDIHLNRLKMKKAAILKFKMAAAIVHF